MRTSYDYMLKPSSVTVTTYDKAGVPDSFVLDSTHPTFKRLVRALKQKDWKRVPKLLTLASHIADQNEGNVEIRKDGIYYKGSHIDNSLTQRITEIIKQGKPVKSMLRFMENLYSNPEPFAINELYDWLRGCKLPITDRGTFMAYKRVRRDYKDCYTGTIDNRPGQVVMMRREDVNKDRRQTCERGLHFCSVAYIPQYPGDCIMEVEINPKDVVSIPVDYNYSKGRTWKYEVVREVPKDQLKQLLNGEDIDDYKTAVFSIAKEHRKLFHDTLELPAVKRLIRLRRQTRENIRKMPYGRLVKFYQTYFTPPMPTVVGGGNPLKQVREAYGLTRGQVAEAMDASYRQVFTMEAVEKQPQDKIDAYIGAVIKAAKLGPFARTGVSVKAAAAS